VKLKVSMVIGVLPGLNKADVAVRYRRLDFQPAVAVSKARKRLAWSFPERRAAIMAADNPDRHPAQTPVIPVSDAPNAALHFL